MKRNIFLSLVFFSITHFSQAQYTKLFDFEYPSTGVTPYYCALISDGTYLYGTTSAGGATNRGVIFKIKRDGSDYQTLHDCDDSTGTAPRSSLLLLDGYLYGTANSGGDEMSDGTIFKIKTDGTGFTTLFYFDRDITGSKPESSLYYDGTYLYGTCVQGGLNSAGTIYKLKTDGSGFSTIKDFAIGEEGFVPHAHVISDGIYLYGMTNGGGSGTLGTVYKIKPDGTDYQDIFDFMGDSTGAWGMGGLVYDGSSFLYGMTNNGGADNRGTIFKIKTDGSAYEALLQMNDENGAQPLGSLLLIGTTLYGLTELGSPDFDANGNMFSIETDGSNFTNLIDFDGDNGAYPFGTLLYDDGAFFGMTTEGGANNSGVIFKYGDIIENIDEIHTASLDLYPNPAKNFITFSVPQSSEKEIHIAFINTTGEIIFSDITQSGDHQIDVSKIAAGIYVVRAQQGNTIFTNTLCIQ